MSLISILASIIMISGIFKIPSPIAGSEFQMSAPIAVIIAMIFGFKIYICAGIIASILSFVLGITTISGIIIAMTFRFVIGFLIWIIGQSKISLTISGPIGTIAARLTLGLLFNLNIASLIIAAIPGILFTVILSNLLYEKIYKIVMMTSYREFIHRKKEFQLEI
ncbi:MAG: hypothetical protein ACTHWZ_06490 [Peptoniphilaceae bacterium]